jgi:hypothetical protein
MSSEFPSIEHYSEKHRSSMLKSAKFVWLEEKVDGSQLSFFLRDEGVLVFCNKGKVIVDKNSFVFKDTMLQIEQIKGSLKPDCVYHGEAVTKKKHNVVTYGRVPKKLFVLFQVEDKDHHYTIDETLFEANRIGVELTDIITSYTIDDSKDSILEIDALEKMCDKTSFLSTVDFESKMEGVVIKWYDDVIKKIHKYKYVRQEFKEFHKLGKKHKDLKTPVKFIETMGKCYSTEARLRKASQHLSEREGNENPTEEELIKELDDDFRKEHLTEYKLWLWKKFPKANIEEERLLSSARQYNW